MNQLETQILETSPGAIPRAKYGKERIKGVVGPNSQFVTSLVLPLFCSPYPLSGCPGHAAARWTDRDA